jgi:L-malate glycosyltransferase
MYVLVVPSWYENKTNNTLGSFFREHAEGLVKKKIKTVVAYPGFNGIRTIGRNNIGKKKYIKNGVYTYRYDSYNLFYDYFPIDIKIRLFKKKLFTLYKEIEKEHGKPDIIHAHSSILAGYAAKELGKQCGIPVVITEHSSAFLQNNFKKDSIKLIGNALDNCSSIIAVSNGLKEKMMRYTIKDIDVIPNMVSTSNFNIKKEKKSDKFSFLIVCYLSSNKGVDILIESFANAFKGNNLVELRIGGDGREKQNLEEIVKRLGITKQVKFMGSLNREQVAETMNKSDCFVLPSRFETFGVVLIEALASGLPVISTKMCGPLDIVNDLNGLLIDIDDKEQLSSAMIQIYNEHTKYNPHEIRNECIERYSEDVVLNKIINKYKFLLESM